MVEFFSSIKKYLDSNSPIAPSNENINKTAILEFVFVFFFVFVMRPSFFEELSFYSLVQVSFVTSAIFVIPAWYYYVNTLKDVDLSKWTYRKDLTKYFKMLFSVSIIFVFYLFLVIPDVYSNEIVISFNLYMVLFVFIQILFGGTLAYVFLKFIDYIVVLKGVNFHDDFKTKPKAEIHIDRSIIVLYGKNKDEYIKINTDNFLYLESIGHYIKVHLKPRNSKEVQVKIIRNSLKNVSENFKGYDNIFQCHRSYIVNTDKIQKIDGNYKRAQLKLRFTDVLIPVSRVNYTRLKQKDEFSSKFKRMYLVQ